MKKVLTVLTVIALAQTAFAGKFDCKNIDQIAQDPELVDLSGESLEALQKKKLTGNRIIVSKEGKKLYLFRGDTLLRAYSVALGRSPYGHKTQEGDNKTPEGVYFVDFKKKDSEYHRALHISYPSKSDIQRTKKMSQESGVALSPGGDIMIHGLPNDESIRFWVEKGHPIINWTRGCVAVTNQEIEELYQLVPVGVEVEICAAHERGAEQNPLRLSEDIAKEEPSLKSISIPGKAQ